MKESWPIDQWYVKELRTEWESKYSSLLFSNLGFSWNHSFNVLDNNFIINNFIILLTEEKRKG